MWHHILKPKKPEHENYALLTPPNTSWNCSMTISSITTSFAKWKTVWISRMGRKTQRQNVFLVTYSNYFDTSCLCFRCRVDDPTSRKRPAAGRKRRLVTRTISAPSVFIYLWACCRSPAGCLTLLLSLTGTKTRTKIIGLSWTRTRTGTKIIMQKRTE